MMYNFLLVFSELRRSGRIMSMFGRHEISQNVLQETQLAVNSSLSDFV